MIGETGSTSFPTVNPLQWRHSGEQDAFVARLSAAGSSPAFSKYLAGTGDDVGRAVALDAAGKEVITGRTSSTDFPSVSPLQAIKSGCFVAGLNAAGSALSFPTHLSGIGGEIGDGVAADSSGAV